MATRKPKGIFDNPLGEINKLYNAIMPGGRDVTQPQSLAQFKDVVRNTAAGTVKAADLYTTGGLGLSFAQNVIQPQVNFSSPETRGAAQSTGMTQFAKDAAITAATAGAIGGASKVVKVGVEGVSSAIKTGKIVNPKALIQNIKSGERVILHASPVKGLTELSPNLGSKALPKENVLFGWNPRKPGSGESAISNAIPYSIAKKSEIIEPGSIYVAKVPTKSTSASVPQKIKNSSKMVVSTKPGKVVAEIPLNQSRPNVFANVQQEMRRAGVVPFKTPEPISNALYKVDDALDFVIEKSKKIQKKLPPKKK